MRFLLNNNSRWELVGIVCPKCETKVYREVSAIGKNTNHLSCEYDGCTFLDHRSEQELQDIVSVINNYNYRTKRYKL